jgi:hypothetical protein
MKAREKLSLSLLIKISILLLLFFCNVMHPQSQADTIGRTTYDLQFAGPATKVVVDDSTEGIMAVWLQSQDSIPFSDLKIYYNYYYYNLDTWAYGNQGTHIFSLKCNNSANITEEISYHTVFVAGYRCTTFVAQEVFPGQFDLLRLPDTGYQYPTVVVGRTQYLYVVAFKKDSIFYTFRTNTLPWQSWRNVGYSGYPSHNICISDNSAKLAIFWTVVDSVHPNNGILYLTQSQDSGRTWTTPSPISESIPSTLKNAFLGAYGIYDCDGYLHLVCQTYDGCNVKPVELWHFSPRTYPSWKRIAYLDTDTLLGKVGYGSIYACRPTIWQSDDAMFPYYFLVAWEQFRWNDVDSSTGEKFLRADIFAAATNNYGNTWSNPYYLTNTYGINERFPYLVKREPSMNVYVDLLYMIDLSAGIYAKGEGARSNNPIVYAVVQPSAIEEEYNTNQCKKSIKIYPNPFSKSILINLNNYYQNTSVTIYDRCGRLIKKLTRNTGNNDKFIWDGMDSFGKHVNEGVYFCLVKTNNICITQKLILVK